MVKYAIIRNDTHVVFSSGIAQKIADVSAPAGMTVFTLGDDSLIPRPDYDSVNPETGDITETGLPLPILRTAKQTELNQACNFAIRSGFISNALGSDHRYPCEDKDQSNMQRVAVAGGSLWCSVSGAWSFENHTAAEGVIVIQDFGTFCDNARATLATKLSLVSSATTVDAINAIGWSDGQ